MHAFWTSAELAAVGRNRAEVRRAVLDGRMVSVRPGLYATPDAATPLIRAARVGGVATAHTAARHLGLWTPPDEFERAFRRRSKSPDRLHVAVRTTASLGRLRDPVEAAAPFAATRGVRIHWTDPAEVARSRRTGHVGVLQMLEHLFRVEAPDRALAVVDSALHVRILRVRDLHALADRLPAHLRAVVFAADGRADSGIETIVRYRLRLAGLAVEVQAALDGIGSVDLLVEGRLIVECDGKEWHEDDEAFERDRRRDLTAAAGRRRVLRLTWFQVLFRWQKVEAAVFAALAA